jgi:translation initiation factor IF-2
MSEEVKNIRLSKAAREFNVGTSTIVEFLAKKGQNIDPSPNTKLTPEQYALVVKEYQGEKEVKKNADQLGNIAFKGKTITVETTEKPKVIEEEEEILSIKSNVLPKANVKDEKPKVEKPKEEQPKAEKPKEDKPKDDSVKDAIKLNVVGKIDLDGGKKSKEAKAQKGNGQPGNAGNKEENAPKQQPKEEQPVQPEKPKQQEKPVQPDKPKQTDKPVQQDKAPVEAANTDNDDNFIPTKFKKLEGPKIVDKIELPVEHKGKGKQQAPAASGDKKKKR